MRIILTNNVPKLGEVGDIRDVAAGYGRNYLIPQGLAVLASPGALKQIEDLKRTERRRQDRVRGGLQAVADRLSKLRLEFTARVGQTGRLYGSITTSDIAERIAEVGGDQVDRRRIVLDEPIRSLGEHRVAVHLMPGVDATVVVMVIPDAELVEDLGIELPDADEEPAAQAEPVEDLGIEPPDADEGPAAQAELDEELDQNQSESDHDTSGSASADGEAGGG